MLSFASLRGGTIIDATLIAASPSTRPLDEVAGRMPPAAGANKEPFTTSANLLRLSPFVKKVTWLRGSLAGCEAAKPDRFWLD
jgi:hypothetical protein